MRTAEGKTIEKMSSIRENIDIDKRRIISYHIYESLML